MAFTYRMPSCLRPRRLHRHKSRRRSHRQNSILRQSLRDNDGVCCGMDDLRGMHPFLAVHGGV